MVGFLKTLADNASGLSVAGGIASGIANFIGAREQRDAINRAAGITQDQFDTIRADAEPFRIAGTSALAQLLAENIGPLEETPDFQFIRDQGLDTIDRGAAAIGKSLSGETLRDFARFNTGLASQHAGNRRQTLASIAGFGPGAVSTTAGAGLTTGGNLANLALGRGDANASSFAAPVNAFSSTVEDLVGQAALRGHFR